MSGTFWVWIGLAMWLAFVTGYGMPGVVQGRALGLPGRNRVAMAVLAAIAAVGAASCIASAARIAGGCP